MTFILALILFVLVAGVLDARIPWVSDGKREQER